MSQSSQVARFEEVTYAQLSDLTHTVLVAREPQYGTPDLKIVKVVGVYRVGAEGSPDAHYMRAVCAAADAAWYTRANILDFTELDYRWGDEMQSVLLFGWDRVLRYQRPLAVMVGEGCRHALQGLMEAEYAEVCRETVDEAVALVRRKSRDYDAYVKDWLASKKANPD